MIENENSRIVIGEGGWRGRLDATPTSDTEYVVVHPEDNGLDLRLPIALFDQRDNGTFHLPLTRSFAAAYSVEVGNDSTLIAANTKAEHSQEPLVVPVLEEVIETHKRMVDTGTVRIVKTVHEHEVDVDEILRRETAVVTRVPVGRAVAAAVPPHEEGDTLIIPIYEERLVVQKQLFLKEEVHVTRQRTVDHPEPHTVTLRHEEVAIERLPPDAAEGVPIIS